MAVAVDSKEGESFPKFDWGAIVDAQKKANKPNAPAKLSIHMPETIRESLFPR